MSPGTSPVVIAGAGPAGLFAAVLLVLNHPFQHDIPGIIGVNYVWTETGYYSLKQLRNLWRFSYAPHPG